MSMEVDGARIRALRLERSWSQELLAERAGVSLRTIQRMETDGAASLQSRRAVAESLGVTISAISPAAEPASPEAAATPLPKPARIRLSRRETLATVSIGALVILGLIFSPWLLHNWQRIELIPGSADSQAERIVTVGYGDIEDVVFARGTIEPAEVIPVQARTDGMLLEIFVAAGDEVSEGQVLALIDPEAQELRVQSARLSLEQLMNRIPQREMNLQQAETEFMLIDLRFTNGIDVESDLDRARRALLEAQTELENLHIDIERSQTELQREEVLLRHTEVRAPLSGTIVSIEAHKGTVLSFDETAPVILHMADLSQMSIEATIGERDIARLSTGTEAWFTTYGNDERQPAIVRQFDPIGVADRNVVQFTARLDAGNPARRLYPGMTVNVAFVTAHAENVLTVPVSALNVTQNPEGNETTRVTVVLANNRRESRQITIGARDRANVEVTSGLEAGDRVVAGFSAIAGPP